ncbi:MAG: glucose-6-phosphate dehydrogenase, partial [Methylocella sp.]
MVSRILKVPSFDLAVFGGTGDLAHRKLFPALFHRFLDGQLSPPTKIIGVARRPLEHPAYRGAIADALKEFAAARDESIKGFLELIHYVCLQFDSKTGWDLLGKAFDADPSRVRAFYLATDPDHFAPIVKRLAAHSLISPASRIIVEKPIGEDGASAASINDAIGAVFQEKRIFRIDHYLGKETVQNLIALRFANALFEPLWNSAHIDHVEITVAESIGVGSRASYYENAGALRDMVQNHLLQLLCLVAMEPPASLDADSVRDEKLKVLRSLVPIDSSNASSLTVRGQYRAGAGEG